MSLSKSQLRHLRGLGHALKPIMQTGAKGLSDALLAELDQALEHHELLKIKLMSDDRDEREQMLTTLCQRLSCESVQFIGKTALLYRRAKEPKLTVPA
ncbi:YhbY family RNA-binding protein [Ectothiorhodospiraceae bacterium BW-2]|nr:YhbY family RNA-binding protein [Ectothiorhodospiraceae bacterium BW-2]